MERKVKTTVKVSRELWAKVRDKAFREGTTLPKIVEKLLSEALSKNEI